MNFLGLHTGHNASASLSIDGRIVGLIQEERFTGRKNQTGYPKQAVDALIGAHLGGSFSRIDRVLLASEVDDPFWVRLDHYSKFDVHDYVNEMHEYWKPFFYGEDAQAQQLYQGDGAYWKDCIAKGKHLNHDYHFDLSFLDHMSWGDAFEYFNNVERIQLTKRLYDYDGPIDRLNHHLCHGYYALYGQQISAPMDQVLVATADSEGDGSNWSISVPDDAGRLQLLAHGPDNHVARIYKFVTLLLGMKPNEHEYKVMGLSGYSKSQRHIAEIERIFYEALDFDEGQFVRRKPLRDSYFDLGQRLEGYRFDNLAAAVQNWSTQVTGKWLHFWQRETGRNFICFSGGLSMNIKMNGVLAAQDSIAGMVVPASGGDESLSAGACFAASIEHEHRAQPIRHVYLGQTPGSDWQVGIIEAGHTTDEYLVCEGVQAEEIAALLAADVIVARCVGPSEFGARALGNRSILANPANAANLKTINDAIKNRDFWMPFTPSILEEHIDMYMLNPKSLDVPYMTIGFETTDAARTDLAAALHPGDFSARPQAVKKSTNPEYWALIEAFRQKTGIPALLNTSLNLHGEPMNYSIAQAARTVAKSELQVLVMPDNRLLYKQGFADALEAIWGRSKTALA